MRVPRFKMRLSGEAALKTKVAEARVWSWWKVWFQSHQIHQEIGFLSFFTWCSTLCESLDLGDLKLGARPKNLSFWNVDFGFRPWNPFVLHTVIPLWNSMNLFGIQTETTVAKGWSFVPEVLVASCNVCIRLWICCPLLQTMRSDQHTGVVRCPLIQIRVDLLKLFVRWSMPLKS